MVAAFSNLSKRLGSDFLIREMQIFHIIGIRFPICIREPEFGGEVKGERHRKLKIETQSTGFLLI